MYSAPRLAAHAPLTANVALVGFEADDQASLTKILGYTECPVAPDWKWKIQPSRGVESTVAALRRNRVPIVLCDRDRMPDAWKELLERFAGLPEPPLLIVTSRLADERLWAEALNLGAYDVLAKPFDSAEVARIAGLACLRWYQRHAAPPALMNSVA
ncbi:MAG TPA: hypothetical protein VLY04_10625 [Bryobacteraceae bacterium]|nr:hypothetical protein [Bryobacteraceae bacterium]